MCLNKKPLQLGVAFGKRIAEAGKPVWCPTNVVCGGNARGKHSLLRVLDEIGGEAIKYKLERRIELELLPPGWIRRINFSVSLRENRRFPSQCIQIEQLRFARVVKVRCVVGNFVYPIDELPFEGRAKFQQIFCKIRVFRSGVIVRVLDNAFANFKSQIQTGKIEIGTFELLDDAERLQVVIEPRAVCTHQFIQLLFAGVAERRMPYVMDKGERLGKLRVEAQRSGDCAGNLRNLQACG